MKKILLTLSIALGATLSQAQNVGIGTSSPNSSAKLDISASDKGILFPNVSLTGTTDASTITSPATGLIVWNTGSGGLSPAGFYYNAGTSGSPNWTKVANGAVLTNTLTDGRILIGNGSNIATEQTVSGDATISNTGVLDLNNNAVETSEINDNAVTGAKVDISGNSNGSLMYYNGTDWVNLAPGTSGQVLRTNGAAAPTWSDPTGIVTVENGLTETAPATIRLGGALTQPTTVSALTATNKMSFTGTGVNAFNVDGNTFSVDASNDRVGIGTVSPGHPLHIEESANDAAIAGLFINETNVGNALSIVEAGNGAGLLVTANDNGTAIFSTALGAVTSTGIGHSLSDVRTSSTASVNKTAVAISSTGTWSGTGASNIGLSVDVSGGTNNYAALFNGGNVGIGTASPDYILDVSDRIRLRSNGGSTAGIWLNNAANSALATFVGTRDDNVMGIYGVGVNDWQFNFDRRSGNVGIGVLPSGTIGENKLIVSRDNLGTFTSNATLSLADNTAVSGRRASIAWHNGGESEGVMQLIQNSLNGVSSRRIQLFDNQSQGLGLEMSGRLWYGNGGSRSETRDNAGLQGNAGAQSGFYETSNPSNFPAAIGQSVGSWYHLIDARHSNSTNNYAMQLSGSFFDQDLFMRKTNNNASTTWSRVKTSNDIVYSQDRNTYSQNNTNAGWRVTGAITPSLNVRTGDVIKIDHTSKFRWTGGSGGDHPFYGVRITGCVGGTLTAVRDVERIGTADDLPRGQWQVIATNYVWVSTCTGTVQFQLDVDNNSDADDNSEYRDIVLTAIRY